LETGYFAGDNKDILQEITLIWKPDILQEITRLQPVNIVQGGAKILKQGWGTY